MLTAKHAECSGSDSYRLRLKRLLGTRRGWSRLPNELSPSPRPGVTIATWIGVGFTQCDTAQSGCDCCRSNADTW